MKLPGAYDATDPGKFGIILHFCQLLIGELGIWLPADLSNPYEPRDELKNWQGAGPPVWDGN